MTLQKETSLRTFNTDSVGMMYTSIMTKNWSNIYRFTIKLKEAVDAAVLQTAADRVIPRFPCIAVRIRKDFFNARLEQIKKAPCVCKEGEKPYNFISKDEIKECAFRIVYGENTISLEMFHAVTDGTGTLAMLKSIVAEYLEMKHGITVSHEHGVYDIAEQPTEAEFEDSYTVHAGEYKKMPAETNAFRLKGTKEAPQTLNVTNFDIPSDTVLAKAREHGVSITAFLSAVMMYTFQRYQCAKVPNQTQHKPVKIRIPVNLRGIFGSKTLRNFSLLITPELSSNKIYTFKEVCDVVTKCIEEEATKEKLSLQMAANKKKETMKIVGVLPLFLKSLVVKIAYCLIGETKSTITVSNVGMMKLPDEMIPFVDDMDLVMATQLTSPYNCAALTYGDTVHINFVRNTKEAELENCYAETLAELDITATREDKRYN